MVYVSVFTIQRGKSETFSHRHPSSVTTKTTVPKCRCFVATASPGGSQREGTTSNSQPMHHVVPEALGRQVGDPYGMHWIIKRSYICNSCNRRVCLVQIPFPCVPKPFMPCTFILRNEKSQAQITELAILATRNGLEPSTSSVTGWRANRLHHRARSGTQMHPPFKDYYPCGNHSPSERLWSG